jgi:hypothetical protein
MRMGLPRPITGVALCVGALVVTAPAGAQVVSGRVLDSTNGAPVSLVGVHLLDRQRDHVAITVADSLGRYFLTVPDSGEYFIVAQRYGYTDLESPLLAISNQRDYDLDLELRPEPIGLGGVTVTVRNEAVVEWLTREFGMNPSEAYGFRLLQGARLEEAKARAKYEPTGTLRWLYVPISHGRCVSINALPQPQSVSWFRGDRSQAFPGPGTPQTGTRSREDGMPATGSGPDGRDCGTLMVDDRVIPNELIDTVDMSGIAVVVTLPGSVWMYTYEFNWAFRRP